MNCKVAILDPFPSAPGESLNVRIDVFELVSKGKDQDGEDIMRKEPKNGFATTIELSSESGTPLVLPLPVPNSGVGKYSTAIPLPQTIQPGMLRLKATVKTGSKPNDPTITEFLRFPYPPPPQ